MSTKMLNPIEIMRSIEVIVLIFQILKTESFYEILLAVNQQWKKQKNTTIKLMAVIGVRLVVIPHKI